MKGNDSFWWGFEKRSNACYEPDVPSFQRVDGGFTVDLAFAEFFKPDFGFLGKVLMPDTNGECGGVRYHWHWTVARNLRGRKEAARASMDQTST